MGRTSAPGDVDDRSVDLARPHKPLDVGNGHVAGSVAADGRLLALVRAHDRYGAVAFEGAEGFPDALRRDPRAVRRYRAGLAEPSAPGLGPAPSGGWRVDEVRLEAGAVPTARLRGRGAGATVTTWAPQAVAAPVVLQWWRFERGTGTLTWGGPAHLRRVSITQLTEGGVLPAPVPRLGLEAGGQGISLDAPGIDSALWIAGLPEPWTCAIEGSDLRLRLRSPADPCGLLLRFGMGATPREARAAAEAVHGQPEDLLAGERAATGRDLAGLRAGRTWPDAVQPLLERAAWYVTRCCALPTAVGTCVVTDHRILPLSWTRDAYYAVTSVADRTPDLVTDHLRWLFEAAERPGGTWARSYLPNGRIKDPAFQLDQQCYPWLELAEHATSTGDPSLLDRYLPALEGTLQALDRRRSSRAALFSSEETPADDPLGLPYHASSHILLWHTLSTLARATGRTDLAQLAADVRAAVWNDLVVGDGEREVLAYAVDLRGGARRYHDANDLPTVLAPVWGFCAPDDRRWRATLEFAFSPENEAYAPGPLGGLGSVHTPGAWALGDVQELVWAAVTGHHRRHDAVLARLAGTAAWDGALPEARDPETGAIRSRHWFAWPGAALLLALRRWTRA